MYTQTRNSNCIILIQRPTGNTLKYYKFISYYYYPIFFSFIECYCCVVTRCQQIKLPLKLIIVCYFDIFIEIVLHFT